MLCNTGPLLSHFLSITHKIQTLDIAVYELLKTLFEQKTITFQKQLLRQSSTMQESYLHKAYLKGANPRYTVYEFASPVIFNPSLNSGDGFAFTANDT